MNLKKKIIALGMVCTLSLGMATSAFAANVTTSTTKYIKNISISGTSYIYLNLEENGQAYTNQDVTLYSQTSSNDQKWYIENRGNGLKIYTAQTSTTGED